MDKSFFPRVLTALCLFLFVGVVYAESLDEDEARYAAAQFFNPSSPSSRLRARGLQFELRSNGHEDGYYIFDRPEGGTIFVADDDAIGRAVLGYTDEGTFDAENLPVGLQDWLDQVGVLMDAVHEGKINRAKTPNKVRQIVVDALIQSHWGQGTPFNNLCPSLVYNGQSLRCVTGCVATAMAQIMKYWKWPNHGYGSVTYTYSDLLGVSHTLSQSFSTNNYNWNNMPNNYTGNYTTTQSTAVATLMRDCGYAVHMQYSPLSSGASINPIVMANHFHYSAAAKQRISHLYPEDVWHEFIRKDLLAECPVIYGGQGKEGGHMFILDGFDASGYYHVNWGWDGDKDGWFMLTNLNGFNNDQYMINELKPDKHNDNVFSYSLSNGVLTIYGSGTMPQAYDLDNAPWKSQYKNVRKIVIKKGITDIPNYFGYGYETDNWYANLEELVLPEGLLSIGECAFQLSGLTSVQLPSTLVCMDNAFWGSDIKSLHLPKSLTGYTDFLPALDILTVEEENPNLSVEDNVLYSKDRKNLLFAPAGLSRIIVAETTESVYDPYMLGIGTPVFFKGMTAPALSQYVSSHPSTFITSRGYLFIPLGSNGYESWKKLLYSGWTVINYADISSMPDVTWALDGGTLTMSGWGTQTYSKYGNKSAPYYSNRSIIKKLIVEDGIIGLCGEAYLNYGNLKEAVLPFTLKYIDSNCFDSSGLTSITCYAKPAPALGDSVFQNIPNTGILRVPEGANYSSWLKVLPSGWSVEYFTPEAFATCYLYNGEQQEVSNLQEWEKLLVQYPNTVGIVKPGKEQWAYMTYNMLVEDALTNRYQCAYLQLTDLTHGFSTSAKIPLTGFVPPVSFDVSKGTYSRKWNRGYNTCCLPFAVSKEELPRDCQMFAYSHFDADKGDVFFVPLSSSEAGCPFFVNSESIVEWKTDLSGKTLVPQQAPETNSNVRGTFVTTDAYQRVGYSPRVRDNLFAPLAQYLHPFRACILINSSDAPAEVRVRLTDGDDADRLKGIMARPAGDSPLIYTLDGKRLSSPIKGHPYIENGKIVIR